ncbi:MAG: metallophosphoesterase [Thermoanaerobaculaceae bacterium]
MFFISVLSVWTCMHVYFFWRMSQLPRLSTLPWWFWWLAGIFLWLSYPFTRYLDRNGFSPELARYLELLGACWLGVLFLEVTLLLVADLITGFGLWRTAAIPARLLALTTGAILGAYGLIQGTRAPVVEEVEVRLAELPPKLDGLRLVQLSDLHLGTILGEAWLSSILAQVRELRPDLVAITGDLVDAHARHVERLLPLLQTLRAPLGVFAVTGNHEHYAGVEATVALLRQAGFQVLRDEHRQVKEGLVLAGIDDLTARRGSALALNAVEKALANRPSGACILLSHTPWQVEVAAKAGVGLMLSGHTHGGQIWPFSYLVALSYPYLQGTYRLGDCTLHVSRGTGTWGPRLRLFSPAEITLLVLRSAQKNGSG